MCRLGLASLLLAGCHWIIGHNPEGASRPPDRALLEAGGDGPAEGTLRLDTARQDGPRPDRTILDGLIVLDRLTLDQPVPDQPTLDKPTLDKPTLDKPTLDEPKPTLDKPKPTLDKPKPTLDKPTSPEAASTVVAVGTSSQAFPFTGSTSWTHTVGCAGVSSVLVVGIARFGGATVASVTGAGSSLSFGASHTQGGLGAETWYRANPPASVTISVTLQGGGSAVAGSVSFCNAGTLWGSIGNGNSSAASVVVFPSGTAGSAIVDVVAATTTSLTFTSTGHLQLWQKPVGAAVGAMGWKSVSASPQIGWSASGLVAWSWAYGTLSP